MASQRPWSRVAFCAIAFSAAGCTAAEPHEEGGDAEAEGCQGEAWTCRAAPAPSLLQVQTQSNEALLLSPSMGDSVGEGGDQPSFQHRFCGIASHTEQDNHYDSEDLQVAAQDVGAPTIWHYNWRMTSEVTSGQAEYVPMVKEPGQTLGQSVESLPVAGRQHRGFTVKGWNEPDDAGQAGHDFALRSMRDPMQVARQWTEDMKKAREKGYREFVGPAMAHDVCWLDHFLKACEAFPECPDLVTYLALHRYRTDCSSYTADPSNAGWRDDLSYVLSFYRLMTKYNARGFSIKGLVWDELGCLARGGAEPYSPEEEQLRYMREWYSQTLVGVKLGDVAMGRRIRETPWIMPRGAGTARDAHGGQPYELNSCEAEDGGAEAGLDAVRALRSVVTVAWFSIKPKFNYLFSDARTAEGLSRLGRLYFDACRRLVGQPSPPVGEEDPFIAALTAPAGPPVDVPIRLVNAASGRALYARTGQDWGSGVGAGEPEGADSMWTLTADTAGGRGYRIFNKGSRRQLYAQLHRNWGQGLGAGSGGGGGDGVWTFEAQGGDEYRIVNALSGRCLYDAGVEGVGAGAPASEVGTVGAWRVVVEGDQGPEPDPGSCERCPVGSCDRWPDVCHWYTADNAYHCQVASCAEVPAGESFSTCWTWEGKTYYSLKLADFPCR